MSIPILSICIPAYNRPQWFSRALFSILSTPETQQSQVEIVISDDSTIDKCGHITHELLSDWQGPWQYQANSPSLGMAKNWNRCVQMATGEYVLILHDDDYLETGAIATILETIQANPQRSAFLFGVNVVTANGHVRKKQEFSKMQYLDRESALQQLLLNSSFVRFPGIILKHNVFQQVGYFDETVGGIADIHLWIRIFNAHGLLCIPFTTANYTVHADALTMNMFNESVLKNLISLFDWIKAEHWLDVDTIEFCKTNYFHQFILAGTVRYLRKREFKNARNVFSLFKFIKIDSRSAYMKWKFIRNILALLL
ncbi:glycosyltransferase [Acaryochloris marina]|uniref:Glycosyl transferase, group 2 family protein, putative n=1 Tax=Acaryochloris marina (strain MBIC 11017) TaxID=329726 RepID=B0BZH6_ACAM1|nr:glycosyltransferase [Acaryochloris marina]ABW30721.1 glycosyl transferase, group 2 family protein, putative [Acaryochloris marina MBIC11017]BDM79500.1 glycosyl transferase [Acaryochloris marina MBIC10699]